MKGFKIIWRDKNDDLTPCFFCRHRAKETYESPCSFCIDNIDIALHKDNAYTEFADFEAISDDHLKVLLREIKEGASL